jgi:hypothetical protein
VHSWAEMWKAPCSRGCINGLATGLVNSSLALGAEYDRLLLGKHTTLYVGADFLASPADVKVS